MERHTNKMHNKNFFHIKQFLTFFVLNSLSVFRLVLCPRVVAGQETVRYASCSDVYCAQTCVCIGQPSRTDALSTSLPVLLFVGVCFTQPLGHVLFSTPHLSFPSKGYSKGTHSSQIWGKTWTLGACENGEDKKELMM